MNINIYHQFRNNLLIAIFYLFTVPVHSQKIIYSELQNGNWDLVLHDLNEDTRKVLYSSPEKDFQSDYSVATERFIFDSYRDNNTRNLFSGDLEGKTLKQLTDLDSRDGHPVWSSDGKLIAFQSMRDGNPEVYLMKNDGAEIQRITNSPGFDGIPKWSPNQKYLVFNSSRSGYPGIYINNLTTKEERPILVNKHRNFVQDWLSENTLLITSTESGFQKLYVLDLITMEKSPIETEYEVTYARANAAQSQIVFTCLVEVEKSIVYIMNLSNGDIKPVTGSSTERRFPTFVTN